MSDTAASTQAPIAFAQRWPDRRFFRLTWKQIIIAALILCVAMPGVGIVYETLNDPAPMWRWPTFWAWDPVSQQPVMPSTGPDAHQTFILKSWLDDRMPFVPIFAFQYSLFGLFIPVVIPLIVLAVSFKRFLTVAIAVVVGELVGDLGFFLFQTEVLRDHPPGDGAIGWIMERVWDSDSPFNGFPSGHISGTTIGIIALFRIRTVLPKTAWILIVWELLTFPAVLFVRQHYLMDVYAGLFLGISVYCVVMFVVERPKLVPRGEPELVRLKRGQVPSDV